MGSSFTLTEKDGTEWDVQRFIKKENESENIVYVWNAPSIYVYLPVHPRRSIAARLQSNFEFS